MGALHQYCLAFGMSLAMAAAGGIQRLGWTLGVSSQEGRLMGVDAANP